MSTITGITPASLQTTSTPVHGPQLAGIWRIVGIGAWAVLALVCLSAFVMSVYYGDLWYRTPFTDITQIAPEYEPEAIEETLKPFQEAIFDLGLTCASAFYTH